MDGPVLNEETMRPPDTVRNGMRESGRRRIRSHELFDGGDELIIVHAGEEYRLRRTRQGKLILTK